MTHRVGINGFGRIGRCALRSAFEGEHAIEWVGINDVADTATLAHLLRHDTVYGPFPGDVDSGAGALVRRRPSRSRSFTSRSRPALPWAQLGADVVLECTGKFRAREEAAGHLDGGAAKVIISAPGKNVDATIVLGVNFDTYAVARTTSCRTRRARRTASRPSRSVLHEGLGIRHGMMTTVHAYTGDQRLVDMPHKDLRRARAAGANIVPTSTGAATAIGLVIPELDGKLQGFAARVPGTDRLDGAAHRRGRAADDSAPR